MEEKKESKYYTGEVLGVAAPATDVVIIVSEPDRTLTIRILDPGGEPVPWANVMAGAAGFTTSKQTGNDGAVWLEGLPPVELTVQVTASPDSGLDSDTFDQKNIQVFPEGQEIVIQLEEALTIQGVVVDTDGNPMARAVVRGGPSEIPVGLTFTDAEGHFTIKVPGTGPHHLTAVGGEGTNVRTGVLEGVMASLEGVTIVVGGD